MDLLVEGQILSISAAAWLGFLIDLVIKGTLIIGSAWLAVRFLKSSPAFVHSRIWTVAFVLLAICPITRVLSPGIDDLNISPGLRLPTTVFSLVQVTDPGPALPSSESRVSDQMTRTAAVQPATVETDRVAGLSAGPSRGYHVVHSFDLSVVVLLWLCVAAWLVLKTLRRLRAGRRITAMAHTVRSGRLVDTIRETESRLCIARPVEVHAGHGVTAPFVSGFFRQRLFLPEDVHDWDERGLRNVLLHELAHVQRRDIVRLVVIELVKALYWFNPLVWRVARKAELSIEMACDDVVCDSGKSATDYARQLVSFAGRNAAGGKTASVPAMAGKPGLEDRVRNIIRPQRGERTGRRQRSLTVVPAGLLVAALLLPVVGFQTDNPPEGDETHIVTAATAQLRPSVGSTRATGSIHEAAAAGDLNRVTEILANDPSGLNAIDNNKMTPVALAAWCDQYEVVDYLIDLGADVDLINYNGLSPLFCALDRGRREMALLFIDGGADPFFRGYRGRSLLHMAARTGHAEIIRTLVTRGVDVNTADVDGYTPLDVASWHPTPAIVELLTDLGGLPSGIAPPPMFTPKNKKIV